MNGYRNSCARVYSNMFRPRLSNQYQFVLLHTDGEKHNMGCVLFDSLGYYVHLSTLAEVREQVLNYIQVMARPMVLHRTEHPVIWTPVYADITVI
jgi:hypothetical protein